MLAISDGVAGARGDRDMAYDGMNRLTSTVSPMFGTASYAYDVLDNLTHVQVTGGSQPRDQGYVYTGNQLTNITAGGASVVGLGYDAQGNLAKNGTPYGFDYGNRMRTGGPESYRYDAYGRRTRSINSTGQILYSLYGQSGQLLWQRDQRTNQRRNYVYLQGSLLAEHRRPIGSTTATIVYQHTDALGSPVATTNSAGTVLQRSEYEPYGALVNRTMEDGPGYTGHATDAATGLVYMQQRYYDPELGEFPTTDPVTPFSAGGAFNRYWYANANPYRLTDPDGRQAKPGQNCGEQPCPEEPKPDPKPQIPDPPKGCNVTRACWVQDGKWHTRSLNQAEQSYLQRVWTRFKSTNKAIPGAITFDGTTLLTARYTAQAVDGITALQAYRLIRADPLSRGPNLIRLSMTSVINFVAVSAAWEAGILGGSMIYEAPTHYGSNITVGEDLGYTIDNAMRSGP